MTWELFKKEKFAYWYFVAVKENKFVYASFLTKKIQMNQLLAFLSTRIYHTFK